MTWAKAGRPARALLALLLSACAAPDTEVLSLGSGEHGFWLLRFPDRGTLLAPLDAPVIPWDEAEDVEVVVLSASVSVPDGRRAEPSPGSRTRPYPRARRVHRVRAGRFQDVDLAESAYARLRRPACPTLEPLSPLWSNSESYVSSVVPLEGRLLLGSGASEREAGSVARLEWVSEQVEPYVTRPGSIDLGGSRRIFSCPDSRGGAWLIDTQNQLFHLAAGAPPRLLTRIEDTRLDYPPLGLNTAISAIACRPDAEPPEPEIFIRSARFEIFYLAPGARQPAPTDFRERFFGITHGQPRGLIGIDTSILRWAGPRRLLAQLWDADVVLAETATAADASGVHRWQEVARQPLAATPVKRSAYAVTHEGIEIMAGLFVAESNREVEAGISTLVRLPGGTWKPTRPLRTDARTLFATESYLFATVNGRLTVYEARASDPEEPVMECGEFETVGSSQLMARLGSTFLHLDRGPRPALARFRLDP